MWPLSSRVELENSDTNSLKTSPCPVLTKRLQRQLSGDPHLGAVQGTGLAVGLASPSGPCATTALS